MSLPDLNLLLTLEALLVEGQVARAARRLKLSPSAMSRALARLREALQDPLLVRAGRGLVPTPRALALREQMGPLMEAVRLVLQPAEQLDLRRLTRSFTLRARDGFVEAYGLALLERLRREAPGVRIHFLEKPDKDSGSLRSGEVDLELGVVGRGTGPEVRTLALYRDRFVGVARLGHPKLRGKLTPARIMALEWVRIARRPEAQGPVDLALAAAGLEPCLATTVGTFSAALALVRVSDLAAIVPERYSAALRDDLRAFDLPLPLAPFTISLLWHPRLDADPAHRWLRACLKEVCGQAPPDPQGRRP